LKKNLNLVEATNINFTAKEREKSILRIASLSIKEGRCVFIPGQNGAGKSSLLSVLGGYLVPDSADIFWKGQKVKPLKDRLVPGFEGIELVKQDSELNPFLSVNEQLEKAARHLIPTEAKTLIRKTVQICHLKALLFQKTGSLSGGEKRRLAIGLALMKGCELLLLDEPFSDLDATHKLLFMGLLLGLKKESGISICIVSHNGEDALWLADEVWTMEKGRFIEKLKRIDNQFYPQRLETAMLLGWKNVFPVGLFPILNEEPKKKWIQLPPEKINENGHGVLLGKAELLNHFVSGSNYHKIWKIKDAILESINLKLIDQKGVDSDLYFEG